MARRAHQRGLVAALLVPTLLSGALASSAGALDDHAEGRSTERGVEVSIERFTPGQRSSAPGGRPGPSSTSSCSLFPWIFDPGTAKGGIPPSPLHRRFIVICDHQPL